MFTYAAALSQSVLAAMSQVGRRPMRTRLCSTSSTEPGGFALLAGDASVDSWFREINVPRACCVHLATGFDFREKNRVCFGSIRTRLWHYPPTLPLYYEGKVKKNSKTIFPQNFVYVKDNNNSPRGKFHRFLFPFSSKISDLNFASYVLYICQCYVTGHTVSLGYLCWSRLTTLNLNARS